MQPATRIRAATALALLAVIAATVWWLLRTPAPGDQVAAPAAASGAEREPAEAPPAPAQADAEAGRRASADAVAAGDAEAAVLELVVVDPAQAPLAQVELLVLDAAGADQRATTDERGRAAFEPRAGRGAVFVKPAAAMPQRHELDLAAGERRIVVAPGAEVSGRVTVDGVTPDRRLDFSLWSDRAYLDDLAPTPSVAGFLGLSERGGVALRCTTDARGEFAFGGLEEQWSGWIVLPAGYPLRRVSSEEYGERRLKLERPERGLTIDLERLPVLTGRVREPDGSAPHGKAMVACQIEWSNGSTMYAGARCDAEGRFELALRENRFRGVSIAAEAPSGRASAALTRDEVGDDLDVGDIVLAANEGLAFRAVDRAGAPIAGALGRVKSESKFASNNEIATTDADGNGRLLRVVAGLVRLRVAAQDYAAVEVEVAVPRAEPMVVTLAPANCLSISVEVAGAVPPPGLRVVVDSGATPLFTETDSWYVDELSAMVMVGRQTSSNRRREGDVWTGSAEFVPDAQGRLVLQNVAPDTMLLVKVLDELDNELARQAVAPLGREELREVVVPVAAGGRAIAGVVRDAEGQPLLLCSVTLSSGDSASVVHGTDAAGAFAFESIAAASVHLTVEREGFVAIVLRDVALVEPRTEVAIVLERGRTVVVEVLDARGRPVEGGELRAERPAGIGPWGAGQWGAKLTAIGRFELRDLPAEELALRLSLAGKDYESRVGAAESRARIRVPVHGRLEVSWSLSADSDPEQHYVLVRQRGVRGWLLESWLPDSVESTVSFPAVLPGEYEVLLGRQLPGKPIEDASAPQTVVVEPDGVTRVKLSS